MSLQIEKKEKNMAVLTIEVSAEEFEKAIEKAYQKNKSKLSVPGFRKGKVPRAMAEKIYGKSVFFEDAANIMIPEAYEEEIRDCGLDIVSQPQIDIIQIEDGKSFIFTAEVALKPEVVIGKYKGVSVEAIEVVVTDAEVLAEISKEQEKSARIVDVEGRAVKDGDDTVIDFEGFVDGVAFDGGKGEDYPLTIGSGSFIPGFEEQLVGAEIGKALDVNVVFPEDYQEEKLKGKAAIFKCSVKQIKEKQLPEIDDDFASEVSEVDTLAEYKESVKKTLLEKREADVKSAKEDAVIDAIIEDTKMDIPAPMILSQQKQLVEDFAGRMQSQGLTMEQYFQFTGLTKETMLEQVKPQAEKRIKARLVLEAIVAAEKIEATEEDYNKEVEKMASMYQMEIEKVNEFLGESEKKQIMLDLAIGKAVDFVLAEAVEGKAKPSKAKPSKEKETSVAAKKPAAKKATAKETDEEASAKKPAAKKATAKKTEE